MTIHKKISITGLLICLFFLNNSAANAVSNSKFGEFYIDTVVEMGLENKQVASLIGEIATYLDKKQYNKFISLTSGDLKLGFSDLFFGPDSHEYKKSKIGLWNLDKFKMITYKQVPNGQITTGNVNYNEYMDYTEPCYICNLLRYCCKRRQY